MKTLITEYRGFEIFFDTDNEEFYTVSNQYDEQKTKKTFSSTKKFIDDFIKDNYKFNPIMVQKEPSIFNNKDVIKIIGIRKDNRFVYEDDKGVKRQVSEYSEKSYFIVDSKNDEIFLEIYNLEKESDNINKKIKKLKENLIKITLEDIKKDIISNSN